MVGVTSPSGTQSEGKRRQITVLFADMVGYTPLSERLGEEALYQLIRPVTEEMMVAVENQQGIIQDLTGDGVMAVFGMPVALEDAPLRACRAALEIVQRISGLADGFEGRYGVRPQVRVGIHAGPVIVGQIGTDQRREFRAVGDTVNLASRLETAADAGSIYISADLQALVEGLVEAEDLGEHKLKGKSTPQRIYRLDGLKSGTTRFDVARSRGLTNLIERGQELDALHQSWQRALAGGVHFVNIVGEAGIGKSRLMYEFRQSLSKDRLSVLEGDCHADGATSPFRPFIEVVRSSFRISAEQGIAAVEGRIRSGLEVLGLDVEDTLPYLMALLGKETGNPTFAAQGADKIGIRTRRILLDLLWQRSRMTPVVMFIEDLHWIDSASEELLQQIAETDQKVALLVVCAYRPQYRPPWVTSDNVTELALEPLTRHGSMTLLAENLGTTDLANELLRLVVEKAQGNPLFVEEIATYLQRKRPDDAGASATINDSVLPSNLQNLVMDRFDRLDEDTRSFLQTAAVIGRKFSSSIARSNAPLGSRVGQDLADLEEQGLVYRIQDPFANYAFKHALVRDAIYDTMLTDQKSERHAAVAEALELAYAGHLEEIAEVLAYHFELTDRRGPAIRYLIMAGRKSLQLFSLEEADRRFAQAVEIIDSGEVEESDFNIAVILAGWSETLYWRSEFTRMVEVVHPRLSAVKILGNTPHVSLVLSWLGDAYTLMGRGDEADRYLRQALAIAEECADEEAIAHSCIGIMQLHVLRPGDTPTEYVAPLAERVMAIAQKHGNLYLWTRCKTLQGIDDAMRGNCDAGRQQALNLVARGRGEGYGGAIALGLWGVAQIQVLSEQFEEAVQNADDGVKAAVGNFDRLTCLSTKGTAMVLVGQVSAGLEVLRDVRGHVTENGYLGLLANTEVPIGMAMVLNGDLAAGVRWLKAAITTMSQFDNAYGAAVGHLALGQIYAQIAAGKDTPPLRVVLKNLIFLARAVPLGKGKALHHFQAAIGISQNSAMRGIEAQALMHIGLLHKAKRNLPEARGHLKEARDVAATLDWQFIKDKIATELAAIE